MLKISGLQVVRIATGLPQSCCHTKLQYSYYCRAVALQPLSQATCYHFVQITSLTSRHGTHLFLGSVERHCESNLSGKRAQHNRQTRIPRPQTQIPRLPVQRRNHEATAPHTRHRRYASFGAKVCSDISPRTLSVPSSKQFSVSFNKQITSKDKYPGIRFK